MNTLNRIAILQANPDKKELEPEYPNDGIKYQRFFEPIFPQASFDIYRVFEDSFPHSITDYDLYLITGSLYSAYDDFSWIERLKDLIVRIHQEKIYLVGFCFGHQIIAQALGGDVQKSSYGWQLGIKTIEFETAPWMAPKQQNLNLIHIHQDQVVKLPERAQILSTNESCDFEAYQIDEHILCCQGHPEFSIDYTENLLPLIKNNDFSEATYNQAVQSLQQTNDGVIFAQWVKSFIEHSKN